MRASMRIAVGTSSTMPTSAVSCSRSAPSHSQNSPSVPCRMVRTTAAGSAIGVVAGGERHRPLEGLRHGGEVAPMGKPVGEDGDGSPGHDAEQSQERPEGYVREGRAPAGKGVNHPAEQDRLGQLHDADGDGGDGEDHGQAALGCEHAKRPCIKTKKVHHPAVLTSLDQPNRGGRPAE